jgi:hypothetical protein
MRNLTQGGWPVGLRPSKYEVRMPTTMLLDICTKRNRSSLLSTAICYLSIPKCNFCQPCTSSYSISVLIMDFRMSSFYSFLGHTFLVFSLAIYLLLLASHVHTISLISFHSLYVGFFTTHSSSYHFKLSF